MVAAVALQYGPKTRICTPTNQKGMVNSGIQVPDRHSHRYHDATS